MARSYSDHSFQPAIFVSYRRSDSSGESARIADHLTTTYGSRRVFFDVNAIEAGMDYERVLEKARLSAQAMLVVIGPDWVSAAEGGRRRLEIADDPVRTEIQAALGKGATLIPVLVKGSLMPLAQDLPDGIKELAKIQGLRIDHETFRQDFEGLKRRLESILPPQGAHRVSPASENNVVTTGGTIASYRGIYVERETDLQLLRLLRERREKILLCGPRHSGKSSMLVRAAEEAEGEERAVAFVDLSAFGTKISFAQFLTGLAKEVSDRLEIPLELTTFSSRPLEAFVNLLSAIPRHSVIVLDEVDILYHLPFSELAADAFSAAVSALSASDKGCSLLLCGTFQSRGAPFPSLVEQAEVLLTTNFTAFQSRLFLERAGVALSDDDFQAVYELTGGHPYLLAVSAYNLQNGSTPGGLAAGAMNTEGPFGIHLRWLSDTFKWQRPLRNGMCRFLSGKRLDESAAEQLLHAGFLVRKGGELKVPCALYKQLFSELCRQTGLSIGRRILNFGA